MEDNGVSIGLAMGLGRRMRQDAEANDREMRLQRIRHEEDLADFQAGIDQVRTERDTLHARLIARDHQITMMWASIDALVKALPPGHLYAAPVEEVDLAGRPMTPFSKAVGSYALDAALKDEFHYYETCREVAKLVGVRPDHHEALALRAELSKTGKWNTGAALREALATR